MPDKTSLCLRLRTPAGQGWLRLCWHAASGRLAMLDPRDGPERGSATELYSLAEQVGVEGGEGVGGRRGGVRGEGGRGGCGGGGGRGGGREGKAWRSRWGRNGGVVVGPDVGGESQGEQGQGYGMFARGVQGG